MVNNAEVSIAFVDWAVQRLIGEDWVGVECHVQSMVEAGLRPGDRIVWHWTVENEEPETCWGLEVPPVTEGSYRAVVFLRAPFHSGIRSVNTTFEVTL